MNIAISAVIIFILLLPPIIFYISVSYGLYQKGKPALSLPEMLLMSAAFSMIAHIIGLSFMNEPVRLDILILLLNGNVSTVVDKCSNEDLKNYLVGFSLYSIVQLVAAAITGKLFRLILLRFEIHSRIEALRIYNHWWYLFNAYKSDLTRTSKIKKHNDLVFIDVLTNTNSGTMLYSGFLADFICSGEKLERIYISDVFKRDFKTITTTEKGNVAVSQPGVAHPLKGKILAIPGKEIININVNFIDLSSRIITAGPRPVRHCRLHDFSSFALNQLCQ